MSKPESEFKCLTCEFYTHSKAQMMEHQLVKHQRFFNPDENKPTMVSQLGHKYWHVKVLDHGGLVWETVATQLDPNEEKLPRGNLQEHSLMPFGKHKGTKMEEVPVEYLHWLYCNTEKKPFNTGVFTYIKKNLKALKFENLDLIWEPK
jgi:uncharacterized protein (DUF3820 family)